MGEHTVQTETNEEHLRTFTSALLEDVRALEKMIESDCFDPGPPHIGAEQEMFLVDKNLYPAPIGPEILEMLQDDRFTTEIARYNLEANLTPLPFKENCLSTLEAEIEETVNLVRQKAALLDTEVVLTGILPTLQKKHLDLSYMTPSPRYAAMNDALTRTRSSEDLHLHIKGLDDLNLTHDNVMLEACNTSFQVHLQVRPSEFVERYNWAQVISGPLMAVSGNSPFLFGKRLWHETRIALFQQSVENRSATHQERGNLTRVCFGEDWLQDSILELFKENITRFRVLLSREMEENSLEKLANGEIPRLQALCLHNGTIWRWNRPCYGYGKKHPHLRIESRPLPAGPTIADEVANTALFLGLMVALPEAMGDVTRKMSFSETKSNFIQASRYGLMAQLTWLDGKSFPASELLTEQLLPLVSDGLKTMKVDSKDIDRATGILQERVERTQTGALWMLGSWEALKDSGSSDMRLRTLTQAMLNRQKTGNPVALWPLAERDEAPDWRNSYRTVGQIMTTDLFTLHPDDLVDLAASVMDWKHIRHIPVEDDQGNLAGIISHRDLLRVFSENREQKISVKTIMHSDPITVTPDTPTHEAIDRFRQNRIGCLPVVDGTKLVGILTAQDFMELAAQLIETQLREV